MTHHVDLAELKGHPVVVAMDLAAAITLLSAAETRAISGQPLLSAELAEAQRIDATCLTVTGAGEVLMFTDAPAYHAETAAWERRLEEYEKTIAGILDIIEEDEG